ncbi:hypothetical protein HD806DRAFT_513136 [Xylariaceae sp. AK1471]|nr:hypothetical protein HD806DRAFT_513136 [Xylariaceae sp. AK1471]
MKLVYLTAIAFFEIGSLLCTTAPNSIASIIGWAIARLGAAFNFLTYLLGRHPDYNKADSAFETCQIPWRHVWRFQTSGHPRSILRWCINGSCYMEAVFWY